MNLLQQIEFNTAPGPSFEDDDPSALTVQTPLVRLIAFYLPQFHAIPENDAWWGKGFTEWTNVTKAVPRFAGHYQPRLPGELGFYDATNAETLRRQAALARQYGVAGFCFHHYWFSGRRLLDRPIDALLANPDIDLPFCLNWANENWTRRWDGKEKSVLIAQRYSADNDIAFAKSVEPYLRDPRYIRVNGRPLLMVYRPSLLPDAAATVERWRKHFGEVGIADPYITMAQVSGNGDAASYGMDGTAGFPPFGTGASLPGVHNLRLLDPKYKGNVVDYGTVANATIASYADSAKVFPGVTPQWDNEARRPGKGFCFHGSTPELYGSWLAAAGHAAIRSFAGDERLVFVNAWNEWAESAYLEPDRHFGYAYLVETARSLSALSEAAAVATTGPLEAGSAGRAAFPALTMRRRARRTARRTLNRLAVAFEDIGWKLRGH